MGIDLAYCRKRAPGRGALTKRLMATRLLLQLQVTSNQLILKRATSGLGWAASFGGLIAMRISRENRRARRYIDNALKEAGLAA